MQKVKISEIFQSIQGGGIFIGARQIFIRFYGCMMHCSWCDTPDSIGDPPAEFKEYTASQLIDTIVKIEGDCHSVSLTGGEPLLQKDFIKEFIPLLKKENLRVYLETNGILHKELEEILYDVDFIAMDIKLPSSTRCQAFWREHEAFLKIAAGRHLFVKVVITRYTTRDDVVRAAQMVSHYNRDTIFILQPNHFELEDGVIRCCLHFQGDCLPYLNDVRVIPQMHKFVKVR